MPSIIRVDPRPVPKPRKEHVAALVASWLLHGRVTYKLDRRAVERLFKVEPNPAAA
jgi:hypothetical protein